MRDGLRTPPDVTRAVDVGRAIAAVATCPADALPDRVAAALSLRFASPVIVEVDTPPGPGLVGAHDVAPGMAAALRVHLAAWAAEVAGAAGAATQATTVGTLHGPRDAVFVQVRSGATRVAVAVLASGAADNSLVEHAEILAQVVEARPRVLEPQAPAPLHPAGEALLDAVSHELRTPLTSIRGIAQVLADRRDELSDAAVDGLLARLLANAERLDELVLDLLDVERLRGGRRPVPGTPGRLDRAVADVAADLPDVLVDRLVLRLEPARAMIADGVVRRVLEHLLSNALRFAPHDSPVEVRVRQVPGSAVLSVLDRGTGVRPDLRERIFEPFGRGAAEVDHAPGLGVGLSLVRELARALGGNAWVTDRDDGEPGAAFHVRLPHPAAAARVAAGHDEREGGDRRDGRGHRGHLASAA